MHDKLLLILSESSISSEWVEDEIEAAFDEERNRAKTIVFPIRVDDEVMKTHEAWAVKLRRQRHIGDFRKWRERNFYEQAFERMLRDLKRGDGESASEGNIAQ